MEEVEEVVIKCEVIEISDEVEDDDDGKKKKKKQRSNKQQIEYLCKYMQEHKDFATGECKTPHSAAKNDRQWMQLKAALDKLGQHRSVEQWKICWRDQKRKARVEGGALNKIINGTGNRSTNPELTDTSAVIPDTIDNDMALGSGPAESPIGFFPKSSVATAPPLLCPAPTMPVTCTVSASTLHPSTATQPSVPPSPTFTFTPPPPLSSKPVSCNTNSTTLHSTTLLVPPSPIFTPPQPPSTTTPGLPSLPPNTTSTPSRLAMRRRVRARRPPDRFLNAQLELNGLIRELTNEVRRSNNLKEEQNHLLRRIRKRSTPKERAKCENCPKTFATKYELKKHIRTHTGERPYMCTICGKTYTQLGHLSIHQLSHEGIKNFNCTECGSSFYRKADLDRHEKIHLGIKPHVCEICSKSFTQKNNLVMHIKMHVGDRAHLCTVCNKRFMTRSKLVLHSKRHEKTKKVKSELDLDRDSD